jgi:steroid delta-isomerase-like uncharacterized protein
MTRGRVESIGITPAAKAPMLFVKVVRAVAGRGLEGDRYFDHAGTFSNEPGEGRDVTLIESEAVEAMNAKLGANFAAGEMRRNIVTRGIALNHLVGKDFRAGGALLRGIRLCEPCDFLQSVTAPGVLKQLIHRGGLRANVLEDGAIRTGDEIFAADDPLEQNRRLIHRFYDEMWNPGNFAKVDELIAEGIVFRGSLGNEMRGREGFRGYMRKVQSAFPDFHNAVEEIVAEGDRVVTRMTYSGTHRGELFGVAPTGKKIAYAGAAFFRIEDGKVAEGWVLGDLLSVLRQLGASKIP